MFFLNSKGGGRYSSSFLICSLLFRSTFFLLREPLLAADRDFSHSVLEGGLLEMSPAFLENLSAWPAPLLAATCVPGPSVLHFIPMLSPNSSKPSFLQALCPTSFAGGFPFQRGDGAFNPLCPQALS